MNVSTVQSRGIIQPYGIAEIITRKYQRGILGTFKQISKYHKQRELLNGTSNTFMIYEHEGESVFDTSGLDFDRLCLTFVLYTKDITQGVYGSTLDAILEIIAEMFGRDSPKYKIVRCWNSAQIKFAIVYILVHCTPHHLYHFKITYLLLEDFLGGGGYGSRGRVFGDTDNTMQDSDPYLRNYVRAGELTLCYKEVPEECAALIPFVEIINNKVAIARRAEVDRTNLKEFVVDFCKGTIADYNCLTDFMNYWQFKLSPDIIPSVDILRVRGFNLTPRVREILARVAEDRFPNCRQCWLEEHKYGECKKHPKFTPEASAPPSEDPAALAPECKICFAAAINTRINPCGHVYCEKCVGAVDLCPHCRVKIVSRDKIYLV